MKFYAVKQGKKLVMVDDFWDLDNGIEQFSGILTGTKNQLPQIVREFLDGEGEIVEIEVKLGKTVVTNEEIMSYDDEESEEDCE